MRIPFLTKAFFLTISFIIFVGIGFGQTVLNDGLSKEIILKKTVVDPLGNENNFAPNSNAKFQPFHTDFISDSSNQNWFKFSIKNAGASTKEFHIDGNDFEQTELFSGVIEVIDFLIHLPTNPPLNNKSLA